MTKKLIPVTCDPGGNLERRPMASLTPFQGGFKDLDDARYAKLKASILAEGFMAPVFVWKDKILDGHQRTTVLAGEGWDVEGGVPVVEIEADTEADAARKLLKLTSSYGKPQPEGVFDFMTTHDLDLGDFADVDLPDFDEDALAVLFGDDDSEPPTDEVPEPPVEPVTRSGDLWVMDKHRVLCGDSTSKGDVGRAMDGTVGCVVTDPPYGINANKMPLGAKKGDFNKFHRGGDWDAHAPAVGWLLDIAPTVVIWGGNYFHDLPVTNDWLCWHKKISGMSFSEFELAWTNTGKNCRHLSHHWSGEEKKHPTQKPLAVISWCLSMTDGSVFDPFLGSGTTLVAAAAEGRTCFGMELDPAYVDVSVIRWQEYTNKEAVLDGDGRTFAEVKAERLPGEDVPQAQAAG